MNEEISVQNKLFGKTFFWMFLGLLGSGIIAWYTYASGLFIDILMGNYFNVLLIVELLVVFVFSFLFKRLPPLVVGILYFVYAMINGATLAVIFVVFDLSSIIYLFAISALLFAALGLIGYKTNKDLTSWGPYLSVFLIAGILLSIVNLFLLKNTTFELILDWLILALFFGITIYDINKMKLLQEDSSIDNDKIHIYCAMQLYLDFINIFLRILSIFGKRKN
ncbi:MAG: Bax inhibitor-1/YccA family protein [Clostridia bacterium]|nr:Bax inhibitor-1/YccA family protein [Clostridia bacterium]